MHFSRLKLVKIEYMAWKKKMGNSFKQMNSIEDKQVVQEYKLFYEVRTSNEHFIKLNSCFCTFEIAVN